MFDNQKYFCKALGGWYAQLELILMMRRINKYLVKYNPNQTNHHWSVCSTWIIFDSQKYFVEHSSSRTCSFSKLVQITLLEKHFRNKQCRTSHPSSKLLH